MRRFSVAPMMDWTDRWCRRFHRGLSARALLFTEMAVDQAVIHGDVARLIGFHDDEHPVALQLGGSEPATLAAAARVGAGLGYDEINLNCGCPSDRVQSGAFGAVLMREPARVAACWSAMQEAAGAVPVTVKCRIGVDEQEPEEALFAFVDAVAAAGCTVFTVHARKAWLDGLSPKENRTVPPLDYGLVQRLKAARPELQIILNGGIETLAASADHLAWADGVMLGRAAYHTPALLGQVDRAFYDPSALEVTARQALERARPWMAEALKAGVRLHAITRHLHGLFHGQPGARAWRRVLSEEGPRPGADLSVLDRALAAMAASAPVVAES